MSQSADVPILTPRCLKTMWTNDTTLRLIELYRSYRCLWDTTNDGYKNKLLKNTAWEDIANIMNMPSREVETKIHGVRSQFIRERKKVKHAKELGLAKKSTWFAYKALMFLVKGDKDRQLYSLDSAEKSSGNLEVVPQNVTHQDFQPTYQEIDHNQVNGLPVTEIENTQYDQHPVIIERRKIDDAPKTPYRQPTDLKKRTDEFDIYGQYVASELRNVISERAVIMAKYHINNIILNARMGKYDGHDAGSNEHGYHNLSHSNQAIMDPLRATRPSVTSVGIKDNTNMDLEVKIESEDNY